MTKQLGVLTPPQNAPPGPASKLDDCRNCVKIRRQAEEAFSELRIQTDKHIHAVQKKLRDDHAVEMNRLKAQNEELGTQVEKLRDMLGPRESAAKSELKRVTEQHKQKLAEVRLEYDSRLSSLQKALDDSELRLARQQEDTLRSARRDTLLRDARVGELEKENDALNRQLDRVEIEAQSLRSKLDKAKLDQELFVEKHTRQLTMERDDARDRLKLTEERIASLEAFKREAEIDKAKSDLHYRRRLGEMESEVRRTEIESVRLRREIIQLNQRLESSQIDSSSLSFPMLSSAKNRLFAIESGPQKQHGRIARVTPAVEELPPPTPSSGDSN
jgi:hypothetical protein